MLSMTILLSGCGDLAEDDSSEQQIAQESPVAKNVPAFNAKTITGATVTEKIFAEKKITMINIWGTFCPPCIAEMPELGDMARSLPDNAQIIGLVCDAEDGSPKIKEAQKIISKANVDFINIVPDENLKKFIASVEAVPTTIFVNSKGEVVGKAVIGANLEGYVDEIEELLEK